MYYYEVLIADGNYKASTPLTYSSAELIPNLSVVSVPLRNRNVTGYVSAAVTKPPFKVKPLKAVLSGQPLPFHCLELAQWMSAYYATSLGDCLRQFAPASPVLRRSRSHNEIIATNQKLFIDQPLTQEQLAAIEQIANHPSTTVLLHGETGSGKTRVYLELAKRAIDAGRSAIFLTPEIALTGQLAARVKEVLNQDVLVLHSELSQAERKKIWFKILESSEPIIVVGPRSALFAPISNLGLIIVDEEHEPAYKQEQAPRYHTTRVASQLGLLTGSKVVLGSATPNVADYFVAKEKDSVVHMGSLAYSGQPFEANIEFVDLKDKALFKKNRYISDGLIGAVNAALEGGQQSLIYYNRRGSARIIMCERCGWQMLCPNCDVPLTYHGDEHRARCHICGYGQTPPPQCPNCGNPEIIYKSIGSKALAEMMGRLFPRAKIGRFDSDNLPGESLNDNYAAVFNGQIDLLVGTQLLAKGLDLPKLSTVGVINAETSLSLPDFTAEERTYQLLYQVIGRAGRRRRNDKVIIQSYEPSSPIIQAAAQRDWQKFYNQVIAERQAFRFPPFSYLMKLTARRATQKGAQTAAEKLKVMLMRQGLEVEIAGPAPSFYGRSGKYYNYQLVVKSKNRRYLVKLAGLVPSNWTVDLDPVDLL